MKNLVSVAFAFLLSGCIISPETEHAPSAKLTVNLKLDRTKSALHKVASGDTIFRIDSLYTILTANPSLTITNLQGVSGRVDSSSVVISPQYYTLAPLRTWKAKFLVVDTAFVRQNTAQSGSTPSTIKLDNQNASPHNVNDTYNNMGIYIVSGTGAGQSRHITDYVGSTRIASITPDWTITPTNSSIFLIYSKDTVYIDSTTFYVKPADTITVNKTLNARYSILRVRVKSDSASLIPISIKKLRLKVDGVVRDSSILNSKTFDLLLTYKYLIAEQNHTLVVQAFDAANNSTGYERTKTVNIPSNKDTTISLDTLVRSNVFDTILIRQSICQTGGTINTAKLDPSASNTNGAYNTFNILITSGTGAGQIRLITSYNKTTKVITVGSDWVNVPDNTSGYVIYHNGTTTTSKLDVGASAITDHYTGMAIKIVSGEGAGQERIITDYNAITKIITVSPAWTVKPSNLSTFNIYFSLRACGLTGYPTCTP